LRLDAELLKKTGVFVLVSSELLAFIGGGYWVGRELDRTLGTTPVLAVTLATLGLSYCVWRIHRLSKHWMKK
jgi:F0F1-type ATP synthase assembly protein I